MKKIAIADATLRASGNADVTLGFKEKIEIVRGLDRLCVDVIETAPILNGKSDILFLHAAAPLIKESVLSCPVGFDVNSIETAWEAIKGAAHPRLHVMIPVSTVQMEYLCRCKPPKVLELITALTAKAKSLGAETEISLLDATRAETEFLHAAIRAAIAAGADIVTICDSAGLMMPIEIRDFLLQLQKEVPELAKVTLSVACSDALHMAGASAVACIKAGASQIKTAVGDPERLELGFMIDIFRQKGRLLDLSCRLNMTMGEKLVSQIAKIRQGRSAAPAALETLSPNSEEGRKFELSGADDMQTISLAVQKLGYELSAEDLTKVYEEFSRIAQKKALGAKDLDAIVATVALQAPPTYQLKSFVINSGNIITSMAHVILTKGNEEVQGFSMGDGPIDAAFRSIENIVGRHFELDDFQISAVTEGCEAVGTGIVRLRSNGKLYSGKGISTDIIGAGIRAYVNALNKICHEEEE